MHTHNKSTFLLLSFLFLFLGCDGNLKNKKSAFASVDLPQIQTKGEITAVTLYSSTSYFQYKMEPMGYEYDLISDFARSQGLRLKIKVAANVKQLVEILEKNEADVIAYPISSTPQFKENILYCGRAEFTNQVIVQRANKGDTILTDVTQLINKDIYVKPNTKYHERLVNLNTELGGGMHICDIDKDTLTTEDLIEMVSQGEIPYTVADDNTARFNKTYFWNIDASLKISFLQRSSWAVRSSSPKLAQAINKWATDNAGKKVIKGATKRYFEMSKRPLLADNQKLANGHISLFDDLFRKYSTHINWDWQLLAAIAKQESRFDPTAVSWAGAEGLMGIMPKTAKSLGATPHELKDPEVSIRLGVDCLRLFRQGFSSITDPYELQKFTLGSYNAGIGHIYDAQRLAKKYGKNPNVWDGNVAEFIRLKSDSTYYNDPVCKHGYLRGSETYNYVKKVLEQYKLYKSKTNG